MVREMFAMQVDADLEVLLRLFTEDFVLDASRRHLDPVTGEGHDAVRHFRAVVRDAWSRQERTIERLAAVGDHVVVGVRVEGTGRTSGVKVAARSGWVVTFRSDLIAAMTFHQSFDEALASVGPASRA